MKNNKYKVCFLDIDGVCNSIIWDRYKSECSYIDPDLDPKAIDLVNKLCSEFNLAIVISSSWKLDSYCIPRLERAGLENIIDTTPDLLWQKGIDYSRGEEINAWLKDHSVEDYIILDDCTDFTEEQLNHFIHINPYYGFTEKDYETAKLMLSCER